MPTVYLNGNYLPQEEACVPVLDRGFIFGDSIYEVIPVFHGKPFRLPQHLQRLNNSLSSIRINNPMSDNKWQEIMESLINKNGCHGDASIYVQVTRGVAPRDQAYPADLKPTVFIMCNPVKPVDPSLKENGAAAITLEDIRWQYCHIKATTLLAGVMLKQQALDAGALEAILVRDGVVTEGTASNVFIMHNGKLLTPPKSQHILPGITRDLILELATEHGLPCEETDFSEQQLQQADEIWVCSSVREILPITTLNGQKVGDGRPGPVWKELMQWYADYKNTLKTNN